MVQYHRCDNYMTGSTGEPDMAEPIGSQTRLGET